MDRHPVVTAVLAVLVSVVGAQDAAPGRRADFYIRSAGGPWGLRGSLDDREAGEFRDFLRQGGFNVMYAQEYSDLAADLAGDEPSSRARDWRLSHAAGLDTLPQVQVWNRLTEDGKRSRGGWFITQDGREVASTRRIENCYNDPDFLRAATEAITTFCTTMTKPDSGWVTQNGRYPLSTIDEYSWGWKPDFTNFVCYCDNCQRGFREYLRDHVYRDETPAKDSNGDGHTLNRDCNTRWTAWEEVRLPFPAERHYGGPLDYKNRGAKPYLWYHFLNYRPRASATNFFAKLQEVAGRYNVDMASMFWGGGEHPGFGALIGTKVEDHFRVNDIIVVEHGGANHPGVKMDYARWEYLNRDARKPMHCWFHMYDHRGDHSRAPYYQRGGYKAGKPNYASRHMMRILSHDFQGYYSYVTNPESPDLWNEQAFWNHFIAAHEDFLLRSRPDQLDPGRRRIAILYPWTGALFYDKWQAPQKYEYEWGGMALFASGYAITPISEDLVAGGDVLADFQVLYLLGCDRVPWQVRAKIEAFQARGGWIWADSNSLSMGVADPQPEDFKTFFGAEIAGTRQGPATIVVTTDEFLPKGSTFTTYGKVTTVAPEPGVEVLATCEGQPVFIRRDTTFFYGAEWGKDIFCLCPPEYTATEPVDEFHTDSLRKASLNELAPYIGLATVAARRAGVSPLAAVSREGGPALNIEVGSRMDTASGVRMVLLKNSEPVIGGFYDVAIPDGAAETAWDLLAGENIETPTDGKVKVFIPQQGVAVVVTGPRDAVAAMVKAQREQVDAAPKATIAECARWAAKDDELRNR